MGLHRYFITGDFKTADIKSQYQTVPTTTTVYVIFFTTFIILPPPLSLQFPHHIAGVALLERERENSKGLVGK